MWILTRYHLFYGLRDTRILLVVAVDILKKLGAVLFSFDR